MELTDNLLWLLKQAFYFTLTTVNDAVKEHGVSIAQIGVLRQLANEPGLSAAELARRLLITPQGVQLALTALEKRGLVQRKRDPQHGRILQVFLTEEGSAVAAAVVGAAAAVVPAARRQRLPRKRRQQRRRLLRRLVRRWRRPQVK